MNRLPLPGLRGAAPLGALAAFGVLRAAALGGTLGRVALAWEDASEPTAVLWTERACGRGDLITRVLLPRMAGRWRGCTYGAGQPGERQKENAEAGDGPVTRARAGAAKADANRAKALRWDNDIKVSRDTFAAELARARSCAAAGRRDDADALTGFATDGREVKSSTRGMVVATTSLCMTAGNQALLKLLRDLAFSLDPGGEWNRRLGKDKTARVDPAAAFERALSEPWRFTPERERDDGFLSLGWDDESYFVRALRGAATPDCTPPRAAVWLAAEALALFPHVPTGSGRACTRGFDPAGETFRWPVWSEPLGLAAARTAVGCRAVRRPDPDPAELRGLGVARVYESKVIELTDYPCLGPAVAVADVWAGGRERRSGAEREANE